VRRALSGLVTTLRCLLRHSLRVQSIKIDRGEHQRWETAFYDDVIDGFWRIGKQNVRCDRCKDLLQRLSFNA